MRFKSTLLATAFVAVAVLTLVAGPDVYALSTEPGSGYGLNDATPSSIQKHTLPVVIGRVLKTLLGFVGTLFLLLMVFAGFLYMTARGDAKRIDQAKQMIVGAIIGVVIVASAYSITSFVLEAATGTAPTAEQPVSGDSSCQPLKCTYDSDCGGACYAGVCRCVMGGSQPCISSEGVELAGQCIMKNPGEPTPAP